MHKQTTPIKTERSLLEVEAGSTVHGKKNENFFDEVEHASSLLFKKKREKLQ